jgi:hypothetical protein
MSEGYRDPRLAAMLRQMVAGQGDRLEANRLGRQEVLDALSDHGALLMLRHRLGLVASHDFVADLLELIDNLCLITDADERDWSEALVARVGARVLARDAGGQ